MEFERFVGCCQASAIQTFEPTKAKGKGKSVSYHQKKVDETVEPLKREIVQVKSSSCLAGSPNWIARPLLRQPSEERLRFLSSWFCLPEYQHIFQDISEYEHIFQFRISWDLRQLSLSECVTHFLLRFWPSAQFAIAPKPFKVEV